MAQRIGSPYGTTHNICPAGFQPSVAPRQQWVKNGQASAADSAKILGKKITRILRNAPGSGAGVDAKPV
jgi:hypothetical protein